MTDRSVEFNRHRRRLYGIAYRMLGSKADAEDMVQEAYVRWHQADVERVQTPEAWLVTTVTRLCIDRLRVARTEREAYVGPWLPEPLVTESEQPERHAELASDLSVAFLVMLERLGPEERAAFLLHEVFDSDYPDIARILGKSEAACRQIVHRARERARQDRPRFQVSEFARKRLLERFMAALRARDESAMLALMAEDVTWTSDGGGKAKAARKIVKSAEHVARFVIGVWRRYLDRATHHFVSINGEPGIVMCVGGEAKSVMSVETDGLRILAVYAMLNPDKLKGIAIPGISRGISR